MPRFALRLEIDGAGFCGTQAQGKGERTVEGVLAAALAGLDGGAAGLRLSSRLDAGVSARGLVASADAGRDWRPRALAHALNQRLPADVAATAAAPVPGDFDPSRWAAAKTYRYAVLRRDVRPVLDRGWWLRRIDRPDLLPGLAARIVGRHDLSGFACLRHDGTDDGDPHRTIHAASWSASPAGDGERLVFAITGSGFLYKQIRGLVGAMIQVARTRATVDDFAAAMAAGRAAARVGDIAPPEGLVLEHVDYASREPDWAASHSD